MAHEVESLFFLGDTPWHGLGKKIERALTVEEAIVESGLDWEVALAPMFTQSGEKVQDGQLSYRVTDGQQLGVVGPDYSVLQNREAFKFFQPFLDQGLVQFETAGSLRGGKRVWVLGKIVAAPAVIVPSANDIVCRYVLLSNGHDGKLAVRVGFTDVRVVCMNTLRMSHDSDASKLIRVRHRGDVVTTLENIRETMKVATQEF
jgi:phage/plasmid-like protein (TIGR03299 family)